MRILYLSQYFFPEIGATQARTQELAGFLTKQGHHVTVVTEIPNHPSGIVHPEYRGKLVDRAQLEGIDVIRVWVYASQNKTFFRRMLFYISYMFNAFLAGILLTRGKYDLIYVTSPPLFVGAAGLWLSRLKKIPMVFEIRDLWPESAVQLGELTNRLAIDLATRLEESIYNHSARLVAVTNGIKTRLIERGEPERKISLIPNGANINLYNFRSKSRYNIRRELKLDNKFVAVYAGIFGIAQGLETILESAILLEKEKDVHFLMIGEGPVKEKIIKMSNDLRLPNITFLSAVPRDLMSAYLSAADASIIPLRNIPIFNGALPTKMFDAWACERPLILCVDGEARLVLEKAYGGLYVPPEEPAKLSEAILQLRDDPVLAKKMGVNGRKFTKENYSRITLATELERILIETAGDVIGQST